MPLSADDVRKLKVAELRSELASRGLDQAGTKATLVRRLLGNLSADSGRENRSPTSSAPSPPDSHLRDLIRQEIRAALASSSSGPSVSADHGSSTVVSSPASSGSIVHPTHVSSLVTSVPRSAGPVASGAATAGQPASAAASTVSSFSAIGNSPASTSVTCGPVAVASSSPPPAAPAGKRAMYATLPKSVTDKVVTGQFVELHTLLPVQLANDTSTNVLHVDRDNESGSLVLAQGGRSTRKVEDMDTWLEAWSIFAAIFTAAHPSRAHELFAYQHTILKASRKFKFSAVSEYDRSFRAMLAADPSMKWDEVLQDQYTTTFDARAFRPFRSFEAGEKAPAQDCRLFNRGKCDRTNCRYNHVCTGCRSKAHGLSDCTVARKSRRSN